jgi:oxygen-independent coproporphyrinogen III oxidase
MSELIKLAESVYQSLPLDKLTDPIFLREPGKYYSLINYPPIKGMLEHNEGTFSFLKPSPNTKRLYLHIPFCSGQCTFCNYRIITGAKEHWSYIEYLIKELDLLVNYFGELHVDHVWFGGGTPSLLSLHEFEYLYSSVLSRVKVSTATYFGYEVHPEMVRDPECAAKLRFLKKIGVNRVNVGVQVFDSKVLKAVNRRHDAEESYRAVELCQEIGFDYINLDLILGLPQQTLESWEATLRTALSFAPTSFSPFYCWMKRSSPIYAQYLRDPDQFPSRKELLLMIIMYMELFERHGYRYGTIDYYFKAPPTIDEQIPLDIDSLLHTDFDVLPLGISGYGFINQTRYMNHLDLQAYYDAIDRGVLPIARYYSLPDDDLIRLNLMYSMRYDNVNVHEFKKRYAVDILDYFADQWRLLQDKELVAIEGDKVKMTYLGKIYSEEVFTYFVSDRVLHNIKADEQKEHRDADLLDTHNYFYDITHVSEPIPSVLNASD